MEVLWVIFNHLSIQENTPGFEDIDFTRETDHTFFEKLQLPYEFLDLIDLDNLRVNSIHLQTSLEEIEFEMVDQKMDDRLISFLASIQNFSDDLVDLLFDELLIEESGIIESEYKDSQVLEETMIFFTVLTSVTYLILNPTLFNLIWK